MASPEHKRLRPNSEEESSEEEETSSGEVRLRVSLSFLALLSAIPHALLLHCSHCFATAELPSSDIVVPHFRRCRAIRWQPSHMPGCKRAFHQPLRAGAAAPGGGPVRSTWTVGATASRLNNTGSNGSCDDGNSNGDNGGAHMRSAGYGRFAYDQMVLQARSDPVSRGTVSWL